MKPQITKTRFGGITIRLDDDIVEYNHDIFIRPDGEVCKRKKKLSKQIYGTSHTVSLAEAEYIYQEGVDKLLVGSGLFGRVQLSEEAAGFFREKGVQVELLPTPKAAKAWNAQKGKTIGLFHITC